MDKVRLRTSRHSRHYSLWMSTALIGHTGFLGGNLARQFSFDECYHSTNIAATARKRAPLA